MHILLFLALFVSQVYAVDPVISTELNPPIIGTNDVTQLSLNMLNESAQDVPQLSTDSPDFEISYLGLQQQRQVNIVNNRIENKSTYSYLYQIRPKRAGTITIPTFLIKLKSGKEIYSPPTQLKVENTATTKAPSQNTGGFFSFGGFGGGAPTTFLQWQISDPAPIQNTGVLANLYVFTDQINLLNNLSALEPVTDIYFDGGVVHEIALPTTNEIFQEQFDDGIYYGKILRRYVVYPLETGNLRLFPPQFYFRRGIFETYIKGEDIQIQSHAISKNLSYVGSQLSAHISVNTNVLDISKEYIMTLNLDGDGNVDFFVNPFQNSSVTDLFISSPETSITVDIEENPQAHTKILMSKKFQYTIIPKKTGTITIPSIELNYRDFNGTARTAKTESITLNVVDSSTSVAPTKTSQPLPISQQKYRYYGGTMYLLGAMLLAILILIISSLLARYQHKIQNNSQFARYTQAQKRLQGILSDSQKALADKQPKKASQLLRQSILYYCADRFGLDNSVTPKNVVDHLKNQNKKFPTEKGFLDLMQQLEFYSFSGTVQEYQIKELYQDALSILESLSKI